MVPFRRSSLTFVNTESATANSLLLSSVTLANIFSSVPDQVENKVKTVNACFSSQLYEARGSSLTCPHVHKGQVKVILCFQTCFSLHPILLLPGRLPK